MTYKKNTLVLLLTLLLVTSPNQAQDSRSLDTRVADLLVQMPAGNEQELNEQMELMLQLEEAGLQLILDLLIPPGTGDDIKARMAVESLSRYVSQSGKENQKSPWEDLILKELEQRSDAFVQSFLMAQLYYIGSEACAEVLENYLKDVQLHDPAIRILRDAMPEKAATLFASELEDSQVEIQLALVNAIKETGSSEHAAVVAQLEGNESPQLQRAVLACLAVLGNPDSYKVLSDAAAAVKYLPEATNATESLLTYASSLSDHNHRKLSMKICKTVSKKCETEDQVHFHCKALSTEAGNYKIEEAVPILVRAMESQDHSYRMTAINYAIRHKSPVEPWYLVLENAKSSEVKVEVLYLLGQLNRQGKANLVIDYMKDPDPKVRVQALKSIALIRKNEAVPHIVMHLINYPSPPDTEAAKAALMQGVITDLLPILTSQLPYAPEGARLVLIEVIADKREASSFQAIYEQIAETGKVRTAALANLYKVSSFKHVGALMELFDQLEDKDELLHIEKALVEAIRSSPDQAMSSSQLLSHAAELSNTNKYIGVLASIGGKEALDAVYSEYQHGNDATKKRAMEGLFKSEDIFAVQALFEIGSSHPEEAVRNNAFRSYIRIVSTSTLPDDQILLLLRKIEAKAAGERNSKTLIRAMGGVKTFPSFITLSAYLDHEDLKVDAANALVRVVLPSGGQENGLDGQMVREKLMKAKEIISGPDSEYLQIDIENYLDGMSEQEGFVSLFNGKNLEGWQSLVDDPLQRIEVKDIWSVRDGSIVSNGKGANLCSIKEYGDIEMLVDWRFTKKGESEPLMVADNPVGEWNTQRITLIGETVTVYLNGQVVVDEVVIENYRDRDMPIFPKGAIELQAHGTDLAFRDIYVKELEPATNVLCEEEAAEGFTQLFNGKDLSNWTGEDHSYAAEDGCIVINPTQGGGNLYTEKEYSDFIFRIEFKLTPGANNGLGIRAPLKGNAAYSGYELQILDNDAPVYAKLEPYQYHGSVYGIIPAKRGFQKPVGEWNSQEVWIKGDNIRITLNGTVILEGNLKEASKNGTLDGLDHPGLLRSSGHIGFLGHGSLLWFRNIRIKEL